MSVPVQLPYDEDEYRPPAEQGFRAKTREFVADNTGLFFVGTAQAFFAFMNVAVQKLHGIDPPITTLQLVLVRSGLTYICCMIYMFLKGIEDPWLGPKGVRLLLVVRGIAGFTGLFCLYFSLQYLSLSDATVLTFLVPICTGVAAALFLKEPYTIKEGLAGFMSVIGVVLIARPTAIFGEKGTETVSKGTPEQRLLAIGASLLGVLGATCAYLCIRAIGSRAHAMHAMVAFSLQATIACSIGMAIRGDPLIIPSRPDWVLLFFVIGLLGFLAQFFLTVGLQKGKAGRSTLAIYIQVVFAVILEKLIFGTVPPLLSLIGIVVILTSALFTALTRERKVTKEAKVSRFRLPDDEDNERVESV